MSANVTTTTKVLSQMGISPTTLASVAPASGTAGAATATTAVAGTVKQAVVQNPAAAADVAALKTQFDALLTKLKDAGIMAAA